METAPDIDLNTDANSLAQRLKAQVDAAQSFSDYARGPARENEPDLPKLFMSVFDRDKLLTQIRRTEYTIRCMILMLVARWLMSKTLSPNDFRSRYISPRKQKSHAEHLEDEQLKLLDADKLTYSTFWVTSILIIGKSKRRLKRKKSYRAIGAELVNAKSLLGRVKRLSRIVMRMDKIAKGLAVKALHSQSTAQAQGDRVEHEGHARANIIEQQYAVDSALGKALRPLGGLEPDRNCSDEQFLARGVMRGCAQRSNVHVPNLTLNPSPLKGEGLSPHPLYFQPLTNWLPPTELWESGDAQERADMSFLHFKATSELAEIGYPHDPPGETVPAINIPPPAEPTIRTF